MGRWFYKDTWCCTTYKYAALEALSDNIYSCAADVWAAGVILLQFRLGRPWLAKLPPQPDNLSSAERRQFELQLARGVRKCFLAAFFLT